jgi:hypothetical protein
VNNGGDPNMSAGQFAQHVMSFYDDGGGGGAMPGMEGMMGGGEPDMGKLTQLAEVLSNPYADEGQKTIAQLLIKREMDAGGGGISPYQAAQIGLDTQRLQLDRDKFAQGTREGPKFFGNPIWGKDAAGNDVLGQLGSDGKFQQVELPEGFDADPGGIKVVNQGTQSGIIDRSGSMIGALPTDVAGTQAQQELGTAQGTAAVMLPAQAEALQRIETAGSEIINDPNLAGVLGPLQGRLPRMTQTSADTQAKLDRFLGQTFPMAMQSLRGLGPASEREGIAAQAAIANLDQLQSPEAVKAAINEAVQHIRRGYEISQQKAGDLAPEMPGTAVEGAFPKPASKEEYDTLKSGDMFQAPDGSIRVKP